MGEMKKILIDLHEVIHSLNGDSIENSAVFENLEDAMRFVSYCGDRGYHTKVLVKIEFNVSIMKDELLKEKLLCKICRKRPEDIEEYVRFGGCEGLDPREFVLQDEGTLNRETGFFYCTKCYIKIGMPLGTA